MGLRPDEFEAFRASLYDPTLTENGSTASALRISKSHYDSVHLPIGARLNRTINTNHKFHELRDVWSRRNIVWTAEVRAFYIAELADTQAGLNTAFASAPVRAHVGPTAAMVVTAAVNSGQA